MGEARHEPSSHPSAYPPSPPRAHGRMRSGGWPSARRRRPVLLAVAAVVHAAVRLKLVVVPLLLALVVSAALFRLIALLGRLHVPHAVASLATLLLGGVGKGGAIWLAVARVAAQWPTAQSSAVDGFGQALHYLHRGPLSISEQQVDHAREAILDFLTSTEFGQHAVAGVFTTVALATGFVLVRNVAGGAVHRRRLDSCQVMERSAARAPRCVKPRECLPAIGHARGGLRRQWCVWRCCQHAQDRRAGLAVPASASDAEAKRTGCRSGTRGPRMRGAIWSPYSELCVSGRPGSGLCSHSTCRSLLRPPDAYTGTAARRG